MPVSIQEFIQASNSVHTAEDLFALFEGTIAGYGFDRYIYSMLTEDPVHEWHKAPSIVRNYPDDWMSYYVAKGFANIDPVREFAFKARFPFIWDDLPRVLHLTSEQELFMHQGLEAGLHNGIGVPFHGPYGEVAGVGLASSDNTVEVIQTTVATLGIIANQFHNVHLGLALGDAASPPVSLTLREREVLLWCAEGKSNWVIGEILVISVSSVKHHVANCIAKLGADSKITAVLKAIRLGLIVP